MACTSKKQSLRAHAYKDQPRVQPGEPAAADLERETEDAGSDAVAPPGSSAESAGRFANRIFAHFNVVGLALHQKPDHDCALAIIGTLNANGSDISYAPLNKYLETHSRVIKVCLLEGDDTFDVPHIEVTRHTDDDGGEGWVISSFLPAHLFEKLLHFLALNQKYQELDGTNPRISVNVDLFVDDAKPFDPAAGEADDHEVGFDGWIGEMNFGFKFTIYGPPHPVALH